MTASRRFGDWVYGCYAWAVGGLLLLFFGGLIALLQKPSWGRRIARFAARLIFRLAAMPISVHGVERLPAAPHILLLNHTSFLDGIALTALLPACPGYAFIVRQQYRSQLLLWPLLRGIGTIVLQHTAPGCKTGNVEKLVAALCIGHNIVVFPEGGFVPEPGLRSFHSGAFRAAMSAKVPVAVAGLRGARQALRPGSWLPQRAAMHLEIGPTLAPSDNGAATTEWMAAARRAMLRLTGEGNAAEGSAKIRLPARQQHLP